MWMVEDVSTSMSNLRRPFVKIAQMGAICRRGVAALAFERAREIQLVVESCSKRDLADREVGVAEQPGRLEHHAVGDELLGGASGDAGQRARQGGRGHAEGRRVVRGVVM